MVLRSPRISTFHGFLIIVTWIGFLQTTSAAFSSLEWIEDKLFLPDDSSLKFAGEKKPFEPKRLSMIFEEEDDITKTKIIEPINVPPEGSHANQERSKVKVIVEAVKVTPDANSHLPKKMLDLDRVEALGWKEQIAKAFEESDVISFTALIGLTVTCLVCIIFLIYRCRKSHQASKMESSIDTLAYDKSSLSVIELTRQSDIRDFFHNNA